MEAAGCPMMYLHDTFAFRTLQVIPWCTYTTHSPSVLCRLPRDVPTRHTRLPYFATPNKWISINNKPRWKYEVCKSSTGEGNTLIRESLQNRHRPTRSSPFTWSTEKARRYRTALRAMKIYTLRSQPHYSIVQYSAPIKRPHPIAAPSLSLITMFLLLFIQETGNFSQVGADKL